mgnify:CR=1 FL=1
MIKIIYEADPEGGKLTMRAEGHAGYAPAGQDIVCAAVSCLMQTLAYSAAEDEHTSSCIYQGKDGPVVSVEAGDSVLMRDKFELVADGLDLLAGQYPENVNFKKDASAARRWTCSCLLLMQRSLSICSCLRQRRRPLPAAEAGRSCWGRGRQDASRAQQTPGAATRGSLSICSCLRRAATVRVTAALAAMVPPLRRQKRRRLPPSRAKAGRLLPPRWMRC